MLETLARQHGTPLFVVDLAVVRARCDRLRALPARVLFAVKANPHVELLRALRGQLDGLDVASGGELERALTCGWSGRELSFAGPGKTDEELARAVRVGAVVNVESVRELEVLARLGQRARVRLRVNPATRLAGYRVSFTGQPSPFGIDEEELDAALGRLRALEPLLTFDGLHVHAGMQCTSVSGFLAAAKVGLDLAERTRAPRLNLGGGFGVLPGGEELDVEAAGRKLAAMLDRFRAVTALPLELLVEPGRWLVGPAGTYVARVVSEKRSRGTRFVVLDGGIHHHFTASGLVGPRPRLVNLSRPDAPRVSCTVVGPLCTPLDTLGVDVELPEPRVGDLLGFELAGAYGPSFSPLGFLGHAPPKELFLSPGDPAEPGAQGAPPRTPGAS
ncbi:MAG: pyridoxal-dependent decarboxylase, exosortase A system-associated [Myxococcota bacterium]